MPLATKHVAAAGPPNGFDHAVIECARLDNQVVAESLDRLMMNAVDATNAFIGKQGGQARVGADLDLVIEAVVERVVAMRTCLGELLGNILIERAAAGHVDQLRSAANAQHR